MIDLDGDNPYKCNQPSKEAEECRVDDVPLFQVSFGKLDGQDTEGDDEKRLEKSIFRDCHGLYRRFWLFIFPEQIRIVECNFG